VIVIHVVVVAPYFGASMGHCLRCFAALEGVRLGVISQQPAEHLPPEVRERLAGHYQVSDALDASQLVGATRAFVREWGRVDRLEGYLEQLQVPLGEARDALGIDGVGGQVARRFRDKHLMKQTLRAAGLPVARQARITGYADLKRFADEVGYPIVVKPVDGAGAKATARVSSEAEIGAALNMLMPSTSNPAQAEEFVYGDEHSFETVMLGGKAVWSSSTFYLPGPLAVLENPWMQYCILLPREVSQPHVERFRPVNEAALRALGLRDGFSHMEWFDRPSGPVVSEVGARPPGANIMLMNGAAHDVDMWEEWTRLQVFRTWRSPERKYAAGCAFLRGQGRGGRIKALHGVEAVQERFGHLVIKASLPSVGQPHSTHYEGDGWAVVRHPDTNVVIEALRALVSDIRIELG
jgi:hypothetical protein